MTPIDKKMKELIEFINKNGYMLLEVYDSLNREATLKYFIATDVRCANSSANQIEVTGTDVTDIITDTASTFDSASDFTGSALYKLKNRESTVTRSFSGNFSYVWYRK